MPSNQGVAPPAFTTPVGQVRLLLGDTDPKVEEARPNVGEYLWYSDDELTAMVGLYGSPQRTAIAILRMIAVTQALLLRKWSSSQLSVDGPAIARTLLDAAAALEKSAGAADASEAADAFQIVPTGGSYPRELTPEEQLLFGDDYRLNWIS